MQKTTLSFMLILLASIHSWAVNLVVSGSWNNDMNGLYVETGIQNGKPYFVKSTGGGMNYAIGYDGCCSWQIGREMMPGMIMSDDQSSNIGNPPLTGWMGITITPEGKNISKDNETLVESKLNNGKLEGIVHFAINKFNGEVFTGNVGDDFIADDKVALTNLPSGISAKLIKLSDSTLVLKLNGSATNHTQAANTSLNVRFLNSSVSGGDTSEVAGYNQDITIKFRSLFTVASSGADFTTVTAAVAQAQKGDIVKISGETFTEVNITVPNGIIIQGEGADKTIIQAAATPNTATGRVFTVTSYDTVEFVNLTIQNGKFVTNGNPFGGGIKSDGHLIVRNCAVKNNSASYSGNNTPYAAGGGIYCVSITLINSEITNNSLIGPGQTTGGGISSNGGMQIINSTIANNTASTPSPSEQGGGLYSNGDETYIINSTITANSAKMGAGYYATNSSYQNVKNSIIYGNTNGLDFVTNAYYNKNSEAYNSIIGASSVSYFNIAAENVISTDPLLSTLGNNGGATQTIALLANSPAINAGTTGADVPNKDQRGLYANGKRDIGAYEFDGLSCLKPVVTTDLMNQTFCNGSVAKFKVVAEGENLNYNWGMTDGTNWMVQPSETKDSVEFNVDANLNGVTIFTIVSNTCGKDTSTAMVFVNVVDTAVALQNGVITANVANQTYQWINVDTKTKIDGETNRSYLPTKTGTYAVVITQSFGKGGLCSDTSGYRYVEVVATGLENSIVSNFSIYPNPATDNVTVSLTESVSGTVSIVDLHGNVVATKSISGNTSNISTAELASGVYVVKINSDKGIAVKQLVIQ
ncbi:MAG: hypothetical protein RLZZ175_2074 [Bacteroidota bacterium]|jgi:hypothetical protein